ncbi:MAG TPA: site-specific integrase [Patescibacteria group bacterium]|nr:site-specific integrase [Patescibacteria group bacterium]
MYNLEAKEQISRISQLLIRRMEIIQKFKAYLLSQRSVPSKATVKNYIADIHHFIEFCENSLHQTFLPSEIHAEQLEAFKIKKLQDLSASSVERHFSSLRKFFIFLKLEGYIAVTPFEKAEIEAPVSVDPFHLKEFKDYLYIYNASHLTIKNYLIDIKQFLHWAEEVTKVKDNYQISEQNVMHLVNDKFIEEYRDRLLREQIFSPASINRKLSSLRKYLAWASEQGLLQSRTPFITNITEDLHILPHTEAANLTEFPIKSGSYSKIPPVRLFQKIHEGFDLIFEYSVIVPLAKAAGTFGYHFWVMKGKPLFVTTAHIGFSRLKNPVRFRNISKAVYEPLSLSTKHFPLHKKIMHHIRYSRPDWYRNYRSNAVSAYFNLAIIGIFILAIGFSGYLAFGRRSQSTLAALPTAPPRILSFQGRLTDQNNNAITINSNLRFAIYNDTSATGSGHILWQEVDKVTPDSDGVFSVLLGNGSSCGADPTVVATGPCQIPSTLFTQNATLYLGVTIEATSELTPRQQLATVAYATNAETLQGLPPITAAGAGTNNVVLALDGSGNLSIGASTTFQSTSGQFTLSGNSIVLNTNAASNGNIVLAPNGSGFIDLQKPLHNSTLNNNITSAAGAVEVDGLLAILATSSGQSAFTINQNGAGPIISASSSGNAKFTVDNSGNVTANWYYTGLGNTYYINNATSNLNSLTLAGNFSLSGNVTSNLIPSAADTYNLGSLGNEWNTLYAKNIITSSSAGIGTGLFGNAELVVNQPNAAGDIFTASQSGNTKFTVGNSGSLTAATFNTANGVIYSTNTSGLLSETAAGTTGQCFTGNTGSAPTWSSCSSAASNFWQLNSGALAPLNITNDLLIGGVSTGSATTSFQVFAKAYSNDQGTVPAGTATTSGNIVFNGTGTQAYNLLNNSSLGFYTSYGGDKGLSATPSLFIANSGSNGNGSGFVGVGTNSPGATLDVNGNLLLGANSTIDARSSGTLTIGNGANTSGLTLGKSGVTTTFNSTSWTATPTISGLITANGGLTVASGKNLILSELTAGSVPFVGASNILSQDNSNLFWNSGSKQLGIGANSNLAGTLDVRTTSGTLSVASISGATSFAGLVVDNSGVGDLFTASSSGLNRFTIKQNGNITDTTATSVNFSGAALTVSSCTGCGGGSSTWTTFTNNSNTIIDPNPLTDALSIGNAGTGNYLPFSSFYVEPSFNSKGNALVGINQTGGGPIFTASQSGNTKFVIDNAGNVGIGTTIPSQSLQIAGGSVLLDNAQFYEFKDHASGATRGILTLTSADNVQLNNGAGTNGGNIQIGITNSANTTGKIEFLNINSGGTEVERMRLDPNGLLGINTTSPLGILDIRGNNVNGTNPMNGTIPIASFSGQTSFAGLVVDNSGVGDLFTASSSGLNRFVITQNGNVGVGTSTPAQPLTISGTNNFLAQLNNTSDYARLRLNGAINKGSDYIFGSNGSSQFGMYTQGGSGGNNDLGFFPNDGSIPDLYITNNTTSSNTIAMGGGLSQGMTPLGTLDLRAASATLPVASVSGNTTFASLVVDNSGVGDIFTASSSGLSRFTIQQNGNIVLGADISTPSALTVRGGIASGTNTTGGNLTFNASNGTGTGGSGSVIFQTAPGGVTVDSTAYTVTAAGPSTVSWKHTVGTENNMLLIVNVGLSTGAVTVSGVTYNGVSLSHMTSAPEPCTVNTSCTADMWYLKAPASGTNSVIVTLSGITANVVGSSISLYNVDQSSNTFGTAVVAQNSSTGTVTNTVTTVANQLVVDSFSAHGSGIWNNVSPQSGYGEDNSHGWGASSYQAATGTSTAMSWNNTGTLDKWADIAVPINPVSTTSDSLVNSLSINPDGNITIGSASAQERSLAVTGTWGGNVVVDAQSETGGTTLINESTPALVYDLSNNQGTNANNSTVTFNITALPNVDGTFAFIRSHATKGVTGSNQKDTVVVQINGTEITSITTTANTTAQDASGNYVVFRSNGAWHLELGTNQSSSDTTDLAEWIPFAGVKPQPGELVSAATQSGVTVQKTQGAYDSKVLGIITTNPNTVYGKETADSIVLALAGRVPTIVTSLSGNIGLGDAIVSSPIPGVGMIPQQASESVGKALESFTPTASTCQTVSSYDAISWPDDNGTNQNHPCYGIPVSGFDQQTQQTLIKQYALLPTDIVYVGKIMALTNLSYTSPVIALTNAGDLTIEPIALSGNGIETQYGVKTTQGNLLTEIGSFATAVIGNIRAGGISASAIATNSLSVATDNVSISGQPLRDYIIGVVTQANLLAQNSITSPLVSVSTIHTNIISPLTNTSHIALDLSNSRLEIKKDASGSAVASIDTNGNASFSGTLNSENIAVNNDATVSGTLHVHKIVADEILGQSENVSTIAAQNITNVTNIYFATPSGTPAAENIATGLGNTSTQSGDLLASGFSQASQFMNIASFSGEFAYIPNLHATTGLFEEGLAALGPTSLTDTSINGQLTIGKQLLLADTSINVLGGDLEIQPLKQGGVSFADGTIYIDNNGNIKFNGTATFNGKLAVNIISPLGNDKNLNLQLGKNASGSAIAISDLSVNNASGSGIFTIDQLGNLVASGAATIAKLNFNLVQPAQALSDTEVVATGSAGTAAIAPYQTEVTIDNPNVTENSLIYISPVGNISGQTPYLRRQVAGSSFTVGIPQDTQSQTYFNWLIVN